MLNLHAATLSTKPLLAAAIWVAAVYSLTQLILWWVLDISLFPATYCQDYIAQLTIGWLLYLLCSSWWRWAIAFTLLFVVLQTCNALKLVILGSPIMPDDFISVKNMFHLFDGWRLLAIWLALILPLAALFFAIEWFARRTILTLFFVVISSIGFNYWAASVSKIMDSYWGNSVWNQSYNFQTRGLLIHLLQETSHYFTRGKILIGQQEAKKALSSLNPLAPKIDNRAKITNKRNVYEILLESFWDPMPLIKAGISKDPLDPRFRKLWKQTKNSTAMSPVYGGYTANSEFEVLCGFPITVDAVFFEGWLRNNVACLPRYLSGDGYRTIAIHPNYAAFWNRVNAYQRIGFDDYWSQTEFDLNDMNREFLGDASLYQQLWGKIQPDINSNTPIFTHIVTFFGHVDYPLNELRPKLITVKNDPNLVEEYVNQIYYKSRELMDFIELLQKEDPNAIIVLYGDHLPYLGPNYDGYVESDLLTREKSNFTPEMFKTFVTTPLIIINGRQGPIVSGETPLYQLPSLILEMLGDTGNSLMSLTAETPAQYIRPLPGITLAKKDKLITCVQESVTKVENCESINQWLTNISALTYDIFNGNQYSLE